MPLPDLQCYKMMVCILTFFSRSKNNNLYFNCGFSLTLKCIALCGNVSHYRSHLHGAPLYCVRVCHELNILNSTFTH